MYAAYEFMMLALGSCRCGHHVITYYQPMNQPDDTIKDGNNSVAAFWLITSFCGNTLQSLPRLKHGTYSSRLGYQHPSLSL